MSYIKGLDRIQINIVTTSLDELIDPENPVRVIDAFVDSLDLATLGFRNTLKINVANHHIEDLICLNFMSMVI